jgi:hypothetical protein
MAKFRASTCKLNCGGHRAGFRYARFGGRTPSPYSSSFNKGMGIYLGTYRPRIAKKRAKRTSR